MTSLGFRRALLPCVAVLALAMALAAPAAAYPQRTLFDRAMPALGGGPFALADVTGDGWTDLVAADDVRATIWVYPGSPAGLPQDPSAGIPALGVTQLLAGDLDGDDKTDLLAVAAGGVLWSRWVSGEILTDALPMSVAGGTVATGDANGDGRADLAAATPLGAWVWFQRATAERFLPTPDLVLTNLAFHDVAIGDADGDGRDDVVLAKPFEVRAHRQGAQGLDPNAMRFATRAHGEVSIALVPGDGDVPYLFIAGSGEDAEPATVDWWRWGEGTFLSVADGQGPYTARLAVGDVNDDRQPDVALVTRDGSVAVFLQRGTTFASAVPDLRLAGSTGVDGRVAVGDVNGDGFADVVLRIRSPDKYLLYLQEDAPPVQVDPIPSTYAVNRGTVTKAAIDLREFFSDDHNRLTFAVVHASHPEHLAAFVEGAALGFEADPDWFGTAEFRVSAWDGNPSHPPLESNTFAVIANDPPAITSAPTLRAVVGEPYAYLVAVRDQYPTGDVHTFALVEGPEGMAVDAATGLASWTPREGQDGSHAVALEVRDAHGGVAVQRFTVVVGPAAGATPALLMAVGIAGTSTALLAAAALLNENAKWAFLLFFLPLYTKIKRERVLDHFVRGQIYGYIQANPGEHYNAIKDALGLTNGSLAHHLRTLEREQFIKSKRYGLYRRFYPMHMRLPEDGAFQPNEVQVQILNVIRDTPGITQKDIAERLGLTPPTVNYHIGVLTERDLVRVVRQGRSTHLTIAEEMST